MTLTSHLPLIVLASLAMAAGCQKSDNDAATMDTTAAASGATATTVASTATPSEATVRAFVDDVFNKGNAAAADNFVAVDFVDHSLSPGQEPGLEGFKKMVTQMHATMPDMKMEVERILMQGDMVVLQTRQTGTHTVSMMGEKPSGNKYDVEGVDLIRFENGKAKEHWGYYQEMKMMQQLGMMPKMPGMPSDSAAAAPSDTATTK